MLREDGTLATKKRAKLCPTRACKPRDLHSHDTLDFWDCDWKQLALDTIRGFWIGQSLWYMQLFKLSQRLFLAVIYSSKGQHPRPFPKRKSEETHPSSVYDEVIRHIISHTSFDLCTHKQQLSVT
jgi:hypothetical protein